MERPPRKPLSLIIKQTFILFGVFVCILSLFFLLFWLVGVFPFIDSPIPAFQKTTPVPAFQNPAPVIPKEKSKYPDKYTYDTDPN
jgi:hypothetical protein